MATITSGIANEANLVAAIAAMNGVAGNDYVLNFTADIVLTADPSAVSLGAGSTLTINGTSHNLSGANSYRPLTIYAGAAAINDLNLINGKAQGGAGAGGLGDGLTVVGGGGGGGGAGLGGGLYVGPTGAVTLTNVGFSGDVAQGGAGGAANTAPGQNGGGGGGMAGAGVAGVGGAAYPGTGGVLGAGGAGGNVAVAVAGVGGGNLGRGGPGGFGGGGGGNSSDGVVPANAGGVGGYGGGGGGAWGGFLGPGGLGGGAGSAGGGGGGGGAGLGGAIFVQQGGTVSLAAGGTVTGTATGGASGGGAASVGSGRGTAVHLQGTGAAGALTLVPRAGETLTVSGTITDDTGGLGSGGVSGLIVNAAATGVVALTQTNNFRGGVALNGGTLQLSLAGSAGSAGSVTFGAGAQTLRLLGTVGATFARTLSGFGTGDIIDARGIAANSLLVTGGTVLELKNGGVTVMTLALNAADALTTASFGIGSDGAGGSNIYFGPAPVVAVAPSTPEATTPAPPPTVAPSITTNFANVLGYANTPANPLPATVTTPTGQILPNPLIEQQKAIQALIARVDAGTLTLRAAQDIIVDMADGTTSVASMSYQFFTGKLPTKDGLAFLVSSPLNPGDINDGYYAGMSLENRYINFAVNLGKIGEGRATFNANYGALSLTDATAKAYLEIFGKPADAAKLGAILTPERVAYFNSLGGDALGAKAAMVGFFLGEAAKADTGPYAVANENFLYDLLDGTAAFGASAGIYLNAGPMSVGLVGLSADLG